MKFLMILIGIIFFQTGFSQVLFHDIDFEMIPQKSVQEYLENQQIRGILSFNDLQASCYKIDSSEYYIHQANYVLKYNIENVWNAYKNANPVKIWNGQIISFGVMYSRKSNNVFYYNDSLSHLEIGQIVLINLRFLQGLYNLAAAFEIIDIDDKNKIIKYSYIEGGNTRGIQVIQFLPEKNNHTKVIHTTAYKSNSEFRDKYLYCYFHQKSIDELHGNMKTILNSQK